MSARAKLTGKYFGRLLVLGEGSRGAFPAGGTYRKWLCECICGNHVEVFTQQLTSRNTKSCGCFQKTRASEANIKHGKTNTAEYKLWRAMWTRCTNPNFKQWKDYGGRGITVCDEWRAFSNFLRDMGNRPEGLTLDRRDVNGNYSPENCRWTTYQQQSDNKRANLDNE